MTVAAAALCGLAGLWVGTFLDLLIERVPDKQPLRPVSLVGRSGRSTRRRGVVVAGTACLFAGAALRFGVDAALPAYLVFFASLLTVSLIDLEHQIIPNRIVYPTLVVSLPLLALAAVVDGDLDRMVTALVGAAAAWAALLVVHVVSPAGMGFGDVRLALVLGLFLGWLGLDHVVMGLFLGFLLGAVIGMALVLAGRRGRRDSVPFGPFLAGGATIAVFAGQPLLHWWMG